MNFLAKDKVDKMRQILLFAYNNCPFYHALYNKHQIDVNNCELPFDLPLVTQYDLFNNSTGFRSREKIFKICATSGTTNKPKYVFRTYADFNLSVKNQIKLMQWCDINSNDIVAIAQSFGLCGYGELTLEASRLIGCTSIPVGVISDKDTIDLLLKFKASVLDITPSHLYRLLVLSKEMGIIPFVKKILVSGEKLPEEVRKLIKNTWNATIFEQYGSTETDGLGSSTISSEYINLLSDDYIFEYLPIVNSDFFSIVVTSLYHKGSPLVRYKLNDIVSPNPNNINQINIIGRLEEHVKLFDNVILYAFQIEDLLKKYNIKIKSWQCIVADYQDFEKITIYLYQCTSDYTEIEISKFLSSVSLEISVSVHENQLQTFVKFSDEPIISRNGKTPKFIDKRNYSKS